MPPLIAALAAGRSTRPTAGRTVGARRSAPTPMATPVTALPLNRSSTNAISDSPWSTPTATRHLRDDKRSVGGTIREAGYFSQGDERGAARARGAVPKAG